MSDYLQQANPDWAMNQLRDAQERLEALEKQVLELISAGNIAPPTIEDPAQGYSGADVMLSIDPATKIITITPWGGNKVGVLENDFLTTRILNDPVTYDASGATVDKYIDVYLAYDMVTEAWAADISVWTNDTTRSEAQAVIGGITVLGSDHSQRFLGIARIPSVGDPFVGGGGYVTWGGAVDGATAGHIAVYADKTGQVIIDSGAPGGPVADYWKNVFVFDEFLGAYQLSVISVLGALNWLSFEDTLIDPPSSSIASPAHPGIMKIVTQSQTINTSGWITLSVARFAADTFDLAQFIVLCDAPVEAGDGIAFGLGYIATSGDFVVDGTMEGIYFLYEYGDTNWSAITRNASTATVTDTSVAFSSSAWFFLEIKRTATDTYKFYINRVLVATHTTTIPANLITPVLGMASETIGSFGINVDYFAMQLAANTQRWT